jgi:hypothetical protein
MGYATGGTVMTEKLPQRDAMAVSGEPARQRADRPHRARGGRTGKKGTHVNVIVAPQGGSSPLPPAAGPGAGVPPQAMPAPRPMMPPGGPPGAPMPPPGIRSQGGRTYAQGGAVKSGPAWSGGLKSGTQVQHSGNKLDTNNIGRGKVITYATGGPVEAPGPGKGMSPNKRFGGGGGKGRLMKAHYKPDGTRL